MMASVAAGLEELLHETRDLAELIDLQLWDAGRLRGFRFNLYNGILTSRLLEARSRVMIAIRFWSVPGVDRRRCR